MANVTSDDNSDDAASANWTWTERNRWEVAPINWQRFARKWRNVGVEALRPQSRVLDLGPDTPPNLGITSLYIRECYKEGVKLVRKRATDSPGAGVIFTGQPGTGKTVFLWCLLICLLQAKEVVLLHADGTESLLFYHDTVYSCPRHASASILPIPNPSSGPTSCPVIWSLLDMCRNEQHPQAATMSQCFVVQAPPPSENLYKEWDKQRLPEFTGFPLWTYEELADYTSHDDVLPDIKQYLKAAIADWSVTPESEAESEASPYPGVLDFLKATHGEDAPESAKEAFDILLDALITRFGPIPRDIFLAMVNFRGQERRHEKALKIGFDELNKVVEELSAMQTFPASDSAHRIIALDCRRLRGVTTWQVWFKSRYIKTRLVDRLHHEKQKKARELISHFSSVPESKGLAGQIFEPYVHSLIQEATAGANLDHWPLKVMNMPRGNPTSPIFVLPDSAEIVPGFPNIQRTEVIFDSANLPDTLSNNEYYVPNVSNLPFFDSFVVNIDSSSRSADLWILQMTTTAEHRGSPRGYVMIHKIMEKIKKLLPGVSSTSSPPAKKSKPSVRVHYVLVHPDSEGRTTWKLPKGWDEDATRNDHQGDGYVLDVPLTPDLSKLLSADESHSSNED